MTSSYKAEGRFCFGLLFVTAEPSIPRLPVVEVSRSLRAGPTPELLSAPPAPAPTPGPLTLLVRSSPKELGPAGCPLEDTPTSSRSVPARALSSSSSLPCVCACVRVVVLGGAGERARRRQVGRSTQSVRFASDSPCTSPAAPWHTRRSSRSFQRAASTDSRR